MVFTKSAVQRDHCSGQACYVCFSGDDLLLAGTGADAQFPVLTPEEARGSALEDPCFIGHLDGKPCYAAFIPGQDVPRSYQRSPLKEFYLNADPELSGVAGYARQIADWNRNFRFCGRCASATDVVTGEHARKCPHCGLVNYPRISPAVIIAVVRGDQILLARGVNYSDKSMFSVLAGFLESGESLEEAVRREIREEVGLEVTNIRYVQSQPWPFPDSLMIGFMADHLSGEIRIDEREIVEAGWFRADALPKVPEKRSISSELIQWFVASRGK